MAKLDPTPSKRGEEKEKVDGTTSSQSDRAWIKVVRAKWSSCYRIIQHINVFPGNTSRKKIHFQSQLIHHIPMILNRPIKMWDMSSSLPKLETGDR